MYKSQLFTFRFLLSSLVMLVLVSFLNNNSFLSNPAMAQEYDKYGDSAYSQYPTDDKKYECRTGPFEGFFVSSVEFCKHVKFDKDNDRKDNNRTGTQGPPGPVGPKDHQELMVLMEHKDHQELMVLMEHKDHQVRPPVQTRLIKHYSIMY